MQYSAITSWARLIWDGLETYGVDADSLFLEAGLDPTVLEDPNGRFPVSGMIRLWDLASEASHDPCFGLIAAEQWRPTTWHGLGFAWLASATLEEAYRRLARYSAIIASAAEVRLEARSDIYRLIVGARSDIEARPNGATIDAFVSIVIHMSRVIYGPDFNPLRVELTHRGEGCRQKRREFFGCQISYTAPENVVEISKNVAREPLPSANADLAHVNERAIRDYLAQIGDVQITERVKVRLIDQLSSGRVRARTIAKELCVSSRTLQRRLSQEGTSFSAVLDDTRRELAGRLIGDQTMTLSEISYLLGFSEVSSFSRSFRRWMGTSPTDYRKTC